MSKETVRCTCSINSAGGIHYYDPHCAIHFPAEPCTCKREWNPACPEHGVTG